MQSLSLVGGLSLQPAGRTAPLLRPSRRISTVVAAKGAKQSAPAAAPPVPSYFQAAPVEAKSTSAEGQQGQAPQAYTAAPPQHYAPAPPPRPASFWSSVPPLVWIGVGVVMAGVLGKVLDFVKGGPQKLQEVAMQQMMNQMMKQAMGGSGGASPFGAAGANPFGAGFPPAPGASPFGAPGSGFPSTFPSGFPSSSSSSSTSAPAGSTATAAPIDTTASPAAGPASADGASAASTSTGSTSSSSSERPKRKAFQDVGESSSSSGSSEPAAGASGSTDAGSSAVPPPPGFAFPPGFGAAGAAGAGGPDMGQGASNVAGTMLDMLKNPEMQKMLYPYLPEAMRNPETFEWMLSNPEYRAQLEGMLQQQAASAGSPAVQEMMAGMDMNPDKMKAQFDALGMTPDQFIGKVMSDPELATSMTKPNVMAAIAECTQNPMNIFKYQNDAEVMRVFEKMSALFPQAAAGGAFPMPPTQQQ